MPITRPYLATALVGLLTATGPALLLAWTGDGPPVYGPPGFYPPPYPFAGPSLPPPGGSPAVPPWDRTPAGPGPALATPADQAPLAPGTFGSPPSESDGSAVPAPGSRTAPLDTRRGPGGTPGASVRLQISRQATAEAYFIRIDLGGARPEDVQIAPRGQGLAIGYQTDAQTVQEDNFDDGRGYRHSYSFARGSMSRRIPLPPDADLGRMTRELTNGVLMLRIPRVARRGFSPSGPAAPGVAGATAAPTREAGPTPALPVAPALGTGQPE